MQGYGSVHMYLGEMIQTVTNFFCKLANYAIMALMHK